MDLVVLTPCLSLQAASRNEATVCVYHMACSTVSARSGLFLCLATTLHWASIAFKHGLVGHFGNQHTVQLWCCHFTPPRHAALVPCVFLL